MGCEPGIVTNLADITVRRPLSQCSSRDTSPIRQLSSPLRRVPPTDSTSRDTSPLRGSGITTHFIVSYPEYIDQYKIIGGDLNLPVDRRRPEVTLAAQFCIPKRRSAPGLIPDFEGPEYSLLSGIEDYQSLLLRWTQDELDSACLSNMIISKLSITNENVTKLTSNLINKRRSLGSTPNWERILHSLDLHFLPRVIERARCDPNIIDRSVLSEFITLFPRSSSLGELINRHGYPALLAAHKTSILRYLGGIPLTMKMTRQNCVELVDGILTDSAIYQQHLVEINKRHLKFYRNSIPWETTTEVPEEIHNYVPHDIIWYCTQELCVKAVLRNKDHIKIKKVKEEAKRLSAVTDRYEIPEPLPFLQLLSYFIEQLDQISLM